jgi:hypothetical protein
MAIARYTFLPWLRRGIANRIQAGAGTGASRATLTVTLRAKSEVAATPIPPVTVRLVGPGDLTSVHPHQVIRTEPRALVSDFESNYLCAVDFYDEDFAWRYSPLAPDGATHRLIPWLTLVALKDDEFKRVNQPGRPLPAFDLTAKAKRADLFPVLGQEWAWAHVHLNQALGGTPPAPDLGALSAALDANPDVGYCRLLCPRKLDANTGYTAFVVPTFEVGRKAGLGEPVGDADDGTTRSWEGPATEFPIYYEWYFRTGVEGDFESLVRALVPRDIDPRVGIRDMDVTHPGFGVPSVANPPDGVVGLEGALLAPTTVRKGLAASSDFVPQVEPVLNAPAEARAAGETDPLVAPPIYGCWHAQVERVSAAEAGWVTDVNLDPRNRAAAGLGARVIREHQEEYMRLAWEQIGEVLTVNHKIRRVQLAIKAAAAAYTRTVSALPAERATILTAPTFGKVLGSPTTLRALVNGSVVPRAAVSPALRKQLRPRGALARRLLPAGERMTGAASVLAAVSAGKISAAPPRAPAGGATVEGATTAITPPPIVQGLFKGRWLFLILLLVLVLLLFALSPLVGVIALVAAAATVAAAFGAITKTQPASAVVDLLSPAGLSAGAIVATPARPAFTYTASVEATLPPSTAPAHGPPVVLGDSVAAADMRRALSDFHDALAVRLEPRPAKPALDLALVRERALSALEPHRAIAARFAPLFRVGDLDVRAYARLRYTSGLGGGDLDTLREVMNYPDIKLPMYLPLDGLSHEYFVPNLGLIPNNTISLMKTNQPFIESYLLGLNHEFARELLWREYPTDQQGSYFRQFWDVSNYVDRLGRDAKKLADDLKDIPRIHQWRRTSALGSHNQRDAQGDASQVVLVVRGDLLKRYPNTFIYAQHAEWGTGTRANRLVLPDETGGLFAVTPPDPRLRFPLYRAKVAPDIHFIGFDLTLEEARGDPRLDETAAARVAVGGGELGWFFVLQEVVGEPRFGMDVDAPVEPSANRWDNLSWVNIDLGGGQAVDVAKPFLSTPAGADGGVQWNAHAADMAFILYQEPVMVAVHGRNMLRNLKPVS